MTMQVRRAGVVRVHNDRLDRHRPHRAARVLQRHAEKAGVRAGVRRPAQRRRSGRRRRHRRRRGEQRDPGGRATSAARIEAGPRPVPVVRHRLRPRRRRVRAGRRPSTASSSRTPTRTRAGRSTFLIETDEATWRRAGFDATTDADAVRRVRRRRRCATCRGVRRAAAGPPADRQPHPVDAVPHGALRALVRRARPCCSATPRTPRTSPSGPAPSSPWRTRSRWSRPWAREPDRGRRVRAVRAAAPPGRGAAAGAGPAQPAVVGVVPAPLHLPVEQLMVAYMTRAGNVPLDRFAATSPDVVAAALGQYAGDAGDRQLPADTTSWVLDRPLRRRAGSCRTGCSARRPFGTDVPADRRRAVSRPRGRPAGDAVVDAVPAGPPGRRRRVLASPGRPTAPRVLTRLDLAERVRGARPAGSSSSRAPAGLRDDLAAGLVSGRADLVACTEEAAMSTRRSGERLVALSRRLVRRYRAAGPVGHPHDRRRVPRRGGRAPATGTRWSRWTAG